MDGGRCKYENGGKTAVSRLELCFHDPHESFDFRLKEDVPVQFRMFFRPDAAKEGEADESELGILISDFDSNDSFDCRIECTLVDGKLRRIHKSVCNDWTFERGSKESWSVRLPRRALRDERRYGKVCVDFRLEMKLAGSHEKENEAAADAEPELTAPTAFQLQVADLRQLVRSNAQFYNDVLFALNYFPGPTEHRTSNCEFVIGHFRTRPFINLRLEWSVQNVREETNFEHSGTYMFNDCSCRPNFCNCGLKRWKFHYIIPPAVYLFSHGEPVTIVLKVSEVLSKPTGVPAHYVWSRTHGGFVNPKILPPSELNAPIQPPVNGNEWHNGVLPPPPGLLPNAAGDHASPVPDPLDSVPAKSYYMDVADLSKPIMFSPLRSFEDLHFAIRYFPPADADRSASFEFMLVHFPYSSFIALSLDWGLMRPDGLLAYERKGQHTFINCACTSPCARKKLSQKYFLAIEKLRAQADLHGVFVSLKIRRCAPKPTVQPDVPCLSEVQFLEAPAAFSPQEKKEELPQPVPMEIDEPQTAGAAPPPPIEDLSKPAVKEGEATVEDGEKPALQPAEVGVPADVITLTDDEDEAVGCSSSKEDAKLQSIPRAVTNSHEVDGKAELKEAKQDALLNGHSDSARLLAHLPFEQMGGRTKSTKTSAVNGVKKEDHSFVQSEEPPVRSAADPRIPPSKRSRAAKEEDGVVEEKKPRVVEMVTIEADGGKFKVDKKRLTTESTFFARAVAANEGAGAFEVDGIDRQSMVAVCEWVERGAVADFEQKACDLFIMAKQLGMPAFQTACNETIKRGLTDENQAALFVFAVQQDDEELLRALSPWSEATTRNVVELLKCPDMKDALSARSPFMAEMYAAMYPN